jgi:tetratricopeptide (TPR) repeat protein
MAHYQRALEIRPDYAEAHYNLGIALAARGRTNQALEHYRKALLAAKQQHKTPLVEKLKARLRAQGAGTSRAEAQ